MSTLIQELKQQNKVSHLPKLAFAGLGWIGRKRMEALLQGHYAEATAFVDPSTSGLDSAKAFAPEAVVCPTYLELLNTRTEGVVIATPSALHSQQSVEALKARKAVFCQKPLGRNAHETQEIIDTARRMDRLLAVDLSYRHVQGAAEMKRLVQSGGIGMVYAVDLVFHNAYGPDKGWFYDPILSGGGCVIDLGIHLIDFAFWILNSPPVTHVSSRLFCGGFPLRNRDEEVEDYATARIDLETGVCLNLACSWRLPAGCDAIIKAVFYGTQGGVALLNVNGSFYDFVVERYWGTQRETIASSRDDWGGRGIIQFAQELAQGNRYNPEIESLLPVAETLDAIYNRSTLEG